MEPQNSERPGRDGCCWNKEIEENDVGLSLVFFEFFNWISE